MISHELEHQVQLQPDGQKFFIPLLTHNGFQLEFNHVEFSFKKSFPNGPYLVAYPYMPADQLGSLELRNNTDFISLAIGRAYNRIQQIGIIFGRFLIERRKQSFRHHRRGIDVHVQEFGQVSQLPPIVTRECSRYCLYLSIIYIRSSIMHLAQRLDDVVIDTLFQAEHGRDVTHQLVLLMHLDPLLHVNISLVFVNNTGIKGRELKYILKDGIGNKRLAVRTHLSLLCRQANHRAHQQQEKDEHIFTNSVHSHYFYYLFGTNIYKNKNHHNKKVYINDKLHTKFYCIHDTIFNQKTVFLCQELI